MCSHSTVTLALVPEPVSLSVVSQAHLIESDGLGQGHPQGVQVRRLVQGQPTPQPVVEWSPVGEYSTPDWLALAFAPNGSRVPECPYLDGPD